MRSGYELFRLNGIAVKLHGSFVVLMMFMAILALSDGGTVAEVGFRLLAPAVLVATVLLHEFGHALAARRVGVEVLDIVLTPLGGMARLQGVLTDPRRELVIAAAGPLTNLGIAALIWIWFATAGAGSPPDGASLELADETGGLLGTSPLRVAFLFNLLLGLLNLVPAFPTDGGRIFRASLALAIGNLRATRIACRLGMWIAISLIILPFFSSGSQWWILPFVGLFLIAAGVKERLLVEAREGTLVQGLKFSFRNTGTSDANQSPDPEMRPTSPFSLDSDSSPVIDVAGKSRIVDDDEAPRE